MSEDLEVCHLHRVRLWSWWMDMCVKTLLIFLLLKDAAATAIYGLRGANGIIMINTKHGRIQPLTVSFSTSASFQGAVKTPRYLGAYDYARLYNEASVNDGGSAVFDPEAYVSSDDPYSYPNVDFPPHRYVHLLLQEKAPQIRFHFFQHIQILHLHSTDF